MASCVLAASFWISGIGSFILMVAGFGLVVFFHELGHFLVAKWVGIKVEEFALGFGPKLAGLRWGETLYRINVLPIGGYVKMLGQSDFETKGAEESDPRAYNNRPIWARLLTVSAGVVMNVVLAGLLFVVVFTVGIRFIPPVVGFVRLASPADLVKLPDGLGSGLQAGDRVLEINGRPIHKFNKLMIAATLSDAGETFKMLVQRPGVPEPFEVELGTEELILGTSDGRPGGGHSFGIGKPSDRVLDDEAASEEYLDQLTGGGLRGGDVAVGFAGEEISHGWQISRAKERLTAAPVVVEVERTGPDGEQPTRHSVELLPRLGWSDGFLAKSYLQWKVALEAEPKGSAPEAVPPLSVLGLQPRMRVAGVAADGPAQEAGLRIGDVIAGAGDAGEVPTVGEFERISQRYLGKRLPIRLLRNGRVADVQWVEVKRHGGRARIGIAWGPDTEHLVVAGTVADTPFSAAIPSGATITALNEKSVGTWPELIAATAALAGEAEATVSLSFLTPGGQELATEPVPLAAFGFDGSDYGYELSLPFKALRDPPVREGPLGALRLGVKETGDFIVLTYATLSQFLKGRVSGSQFVGPVGIFRAGVNVGQQGVVWVVWLLAIISANLAVINFLPLPIVDGGHVVFLLIEKLRRRPLSVQVQNAVQIAGLAMIVVVFVLLTYNDIAQWVSGIWR